MKLIINIYLSTITITLLNELEPISSFKILGFFETFKIIRNKSDRVIDINYRDVEVVLYKISY